MIENTQKKYNTNFRISITFFILLLFCGTITNLPLESKSKSTKYKKNLTRVEFFKERMSEKEREYYEPRKRFIDKQSVRPSDEFFYQIDIILRGTALREKNKRNIKEIEKLEKFLRNADDFQLSRYFGSNEELYLGMKANKAIMSITRDAKLDEDWRRKNDPIFTRYLTKKATKKERIFYKQNKGLFFKRETGEYLIEFLQNEAKNSNLATN